MNLFVFEGWVFLIVLEFLMRFRGLNTVHSLVRNQRVHRVKTNHKPSYEDLCHAVDLACVFYFKRVLCLQRAATTTLLLRRNGYRAEMVIGVQLLPFKSHAWVEIDGKVVNDKSYTSDIYQTLERC